VERQDQEVKVKDYQVTEDQEAKEDHPRVDQGHQKEGTMKKDTDYMLQISMLSAVRKTWSAFSRSMAH